MASLKCPWKGIVYSDTGGIELAKRPSNFRGQRAARQAEDNMAIQDAPVVGIGNGLSRRCLAGILRHTRRVVVAGLLASSFGAVGCSEPSPQKVVAKQSERLEVTDGLVAAYDFEEGSGATAADISGSGNTGTLTGPTWISEGRRGSALSFDGVDDRVIVADSASLDLTTGMTLMAWVRPTTSESDYWTVVLKELGSGDLAYGLYASEPSGTATAWFQTGGSDAFAWGNPHSPRTDRWTHLAASYDGSTFSFYANGRRTSSTPVSGTIETSSEVLSIGGNGIWGEWFQGFIDEVRVYNRGLSQSEIVLEMGGISPGPAPALVAAYNFDEGSGTVAADSSASSNAGTLSGPTWSAAGKHGGALSFDGTDDRVIVADSSSLDLTYGMTLMAWVNPLSIDSNWRTVVMKEISTSELAYVLYADDNGGQPPASYFTRDGFYYGATASSPLLVDTWSHLAVAYNSITLDVFVNGELVGTHDVDGDIDTSSEALSIGGNAIWGEWFEGLIDDVRIYNNGLTQAEIAADMNTPVGAGAGCSPGCDDGNACNGIETCVNGSCVAGTPITCNPLDQCHDAGTCNVATGICSNPPKANGTACNDSTVCNGSETCQSGACTPGAPPATDDSNPCTTDACDAIAGVTHTPVAAGTTCADADACDGVEACNGAGACAAGSPPPVDDGNPCTADSCNPTTGPIHEPLSQVGCDDGNLCNGFDFCLSGICRHDTTFDDGNPCTMDTCNPQTGETTYTPVAQGTTCGDACTGAGACDAFGSCQVTTPGAGIEDDGNPCTADTCNSETGARAASGRYVMRPRLGRV